MISDGIAETYWFSVLTPAVRRDPALLNCMYIKVYSRAAPEVIETHCIQTPATDSSQVTSCDWVSPPCSCFFLTAAKQRSRGLFGTSLWVVFVRGHLHSQCTTYLLYITLHVGML